MALVLADRVKESCTSPGTGTVTLLGAASGFQSFAAIGNGNTTYYCIADQSGTNWEVGVGTYTSAGTTLARTTVLASSNAGSLVNFVSGSQDVFCTYASGRSIYNTEALGYSDTGILANFASTVAGYNQVIVQNKDAGSTSSANVGVANNAGTATTNFVEMGINSSGFTGSGSFNTASYSYLASASTELAIGTYGANGIHFVVNNGATDAGSISSAGRWAINNSTTNTTATALLHLGAGTATASTAPLKFTSGTNLTTAEAGAYEYDGTNFYRTSDTTHGRNLAPQFQQFVLSSNVTAFGPASGDFFGTTSSASLAAATTYDIECFCYFLKTTAGTGQWIPTFSSAITVGHSYLEYTPVTGFTTTVITGAMVVAEATQQTTTVLTHAATASLTSAVSHVAKLKIRVTTNLACNFRLKFVGSAGTITPQTGSWYTVRRVTSNAGNFVA